MCIMMILSSHTNNYACAAFCCGASSTYLVMLCFTQCACIFIFIVFLAIHISLGVYFPVFYSLPQSLSIYFPPFNKFLLH